MAFLNAPFGRLKQFRPSLAFLYQQGFLSCKGTKEYYLQKDPLPGSLNDDLEMGELYYLFRHKEWKNF
jgi:hypothetical protein